MKKSKGCQNLKKSLFLTLMMIATAMSWGQDPLELKKITGLNEFYLYDGNTVTLSYAVADENYDEVDAEYYSSTITDEDGNSVLSASLSAKGKYTLTIIGDNTNYTGILTATFYIWNTTGFSGTGSSIYDPYMINNEDDWMKLCASLYLAESDNPSDGKFYKLGDDISVVTMAGQYSFPFIGTFDGDGKTLTFNKGSYGQRFDDAMDPYCAPFRYTDGASIHDLVVNGSIYTEVGGAGGLIGWNISEVTTVQDVIVRVNIHNNEEAFYDGGVAAVGSSVRFINCVYNGLMSSYSWGGGFTPYGNANTYAENCLFNPDPNSKSWGENFVSYNDDGDYEDPYSYPDNIVDCYYTMQTSVSFNWGDILSTQGIQAYADDVPEGTIGRYIKTIKGFSIYTPVTVSITGVDNEYLYTGSAISITPTVTFNDASASGHYDVSFVNSYGETVSEIIEIGDYTMIITAKNGYSGSTTKEFSVYSNDYGIWSDLAAMIANTSISTISLDCNYRAGSGDAVLVINRDVNIELNGYTIDRHLSEATEDGQVIRINSGKTVSITGPGIITGAWNKAKNTTSGSADNDGGGIYNKGNLTLNKVTVSNNHCEKKTQGTSATARGGGIYSGKNSSLTLINVSIRENTAQGGGGGVFADEATTFVVKDNSIIRSNVSADKGGGIRVKKCGTATIINSFINNNTVNNATKESVANGGGVYCEEGSVTIKRCEINNNIASKFGGGIYIQSGTVYAKDCTINKNQSYDENRLFNSRGGGVYLYNGNCTFIMSGGTIYGNSSNLAYGGGVFVNNGATFKVRGNVDINGNWRFYNATGSYETTNVYITGKTSSDVITIDSLIGSTSKIGVAKNGGGVFTSGLSGHGDESNFTSDDKSYEIGKQDNEAKFINPAPWSPSVVPSGEYIINSTVIIDHEYTGINKISFGDNGKMIIIENGYLETNIINDDVNKVMIYGGQLKVVPEDADVKATMRKDISAAYALSSQNWYLISSGITNPSLVTNTNLLRMADEFPEYDLYRFNEGVELQWENYRAGHADFTLLQNGRGYLYRNANDYTINIRGTLNTSAVDYTLSYTETVNSEDNKVIGFNIIGNPYSFNVYKGAVGSAIPNGTLLETNYYVLNQSTGVFTLENDGTAIPPLAGILVQAKKQDNADDYILHMAYSQEGYVAPSSKSDRENIWFTIGND